MAVSYTHLDVYKRQQQESERPVVERPKALGDIRGITYIYGIFYEFALLEMPEKAKEVLEKAFLLDTTDARIFLELDQLYKKLGYSVENRIAFYEKYSETFAKRDDVFIEYITDVYKRQIYMR